MLRRKRKASDFEAEIEAHIDLEAERLREQGLSEAEARHRARRVFGNVGRAQEVFHDTGPWAWSDQLRRDLQFAFRMLRRSPAFATIAILTMAVGIGGTTAIFSVVDATLLHPLPYPHPEQLVSIYDDMPGVGSHDIGITVPEWRDLERSGIFEYVSPVWYDDNNLTGSSSLPMRVGILSVAPNYFSLLGVKPQLGSTFDPADPTPGYLLQVVIGDGLWQRAFGRDPHILNRKLRLDTDLYQIIGVMPPGFQNPGRTIADRRVDVWPAAGYSATPFWTPPTRKNHVPGAIARLKPGLTVPVAQSKIDALVTSLRQQFPSDYPPESGWTIRLAPLQETLVGDVRQPLILLLGAVALVLMIGCVNVANLLLARASARGREMAVRLALGAAGGRLRRQLLTESLLLSVLGGIAGMAILVAAKGSLVRLIPDSLPRLNEVSISWGVLLFAFGASLAAGTIFGLAPALHAGRLDIAQSLKREGRGSTASRAQTRTRRLLVITEFALSLVLMIAAGLLLRSFHDLLHVTLGFEPERVMTVRTRLPYPNDPTTDLYATPAQQGPFFREITRRCSTLPGVEEVALGNNPAVPLDHAQKDQNVVPMIIEDRGTAISTAPLVNSSIISPEYFHLLGMRLARGRFFSKFDSESAPAAAVINEAMAQTYWPGEDPLGKRVKLSRRAISWTTIVGIVADARTESLEDPRVPQIYTNLYQVGAKHLAIFLRGRLDAPAIGAAVREQVQAVNSDLPVFGAMTLHDVVSDSLAVRRFSVEMIALFALVALLLAALGIYGVISYLVAERTHEIGIHIALGARPAYIMRMVLRQGLSLAIAGAALGLVAARIASHFMAGLLYGVRPADPVTFIGVTVLFALVAVAACYIPARRALRVDPLLALRCE